MKQPGQKRTLILEDGSCFSGRAFGTDKEVTGEVVFNTGMVGYPETLTDPSYRGQILVLTYPLIGNYGVPAEEREQELLKFFESDAIHVRALIVADYCEEYSHWNAAKSLDAWLKEHDIPAITGVDTRALTKKLREQGVMLGKVGVASDAQDEFVDPNATNLVAQVSVKEKKVYRAKVNDGDAVSPKILLVDCGVKNNIIRSFIKRNVTVIRVPWDYDYSQEEYDGLFLSNGPGDPKQCVATIAHLKRALDQEKPIFGICLGSQLMALAAGADTYKLKYGHRGQNQPCIEVGTKRCYITSQNHGFAVDEKSLPKEWLPWFVNANDKTNEGIKHTNKPFMACQFHPEATPGPTDTDFLFDLFIEQIKGGKK